MKKFRRILGEDPGVGRPPLGTKHLFFFFVNLQNIRKIKAIRVRHPPVLKILDPPLNLASLTTAYIA